jgi:hypothetical protein
MSTDAYGELPRRDAGATATTSVLSTTGASPATYESSWSGVARASTVTGSVPTPGKRACRFCCSRTLSNESGSRLAPPFSSLSDSSGAPAASSNAATPTATNQARGCTTRASLEKNPSAGASARRTGIRPPTSASSAGTSVSAASSATTTTATPAAPMARNVGSSKIISADSETATVSAENAIVRPAMAAVRSTASGTDSPPARSSRNRLTISSA